MESAGLAEQKLGVKVIIIKKTSKEYSSENNPPICPSVALDDVLIVSNGTVTFEQLKAAISDRGKV